MKKVILAAFLACGVLAQASDCSPLNNPKERWKVLSKTSEMGKLEYYIKGTVVSPKLYVVIEDAPHGIENILDTAIQMNKTFSMQDATPCVESSGGGPQINGSDVNLLGIGPF
jgi:hypothetical protein